MLRIAKKRVGRLFSTVVLRDFHRYRVTAWTLALGLAAPRMSQAAADNWINPAGGNWTDVTNWSLGQLPNNINGANFSLASPTGYTVLGGSGDVAINVQNDQVTLNGANINQNSAAPALTETSTTGQTTNLTLENGSIVSLGGQANVGGTGGTTALMLNQFTINSHQLIDIGGSGTSITNYNQSGGELRSNSGVLFGNGSGTVNANISGGTLSSDGGVTFGPSGTVTAALSSVTINNANFDVGTGTGNATVTADKSTFSVAGDLVVGAPSVLGFPTSLPATGGGTGKLTLTNSSSTASVLLVGDSGGNGTLIGSGSGTTFTSNLYMIVGDFGTGVVDFSNGANITSAGGSIGGNGGNGTVTLSGNTTVQNVPGSNVSIGSFAGSVGTGLFELDNGASLTLHFASIPPEGPTPAEVVGNISLSSSGTLEVLSGARASAYQLDEVGGSTLEIGLDGATATANGQVDLTGQATLAGTLDVVLENGFQPTVGEQFQLLSFVGESGQFSTLNLPLPYTWDTSALYTQGIITVTSVPEPMGAGLLLLAGARMLGRRRR